MMRLMGKVVWKGLLSRSCNHDCRCNHDAFHVVSGTLKNSGMSVMPGGCSGKDAQYGEFKSLMRGSEAPLARLRVRSTKERMCVA
jgi:hypothetical protein